MTRSLAAFALALVACSAVRADDPLAWKRLPPLPDPIGFAGSFAGTSGDTLIVAGGANFPDAPPWEGGVKTWTDRVFLLDRPDGSWRESEARLGQPLGYGVSISTDEGLICLGGSDASRHYDEVFSLKFVEGQLTRTELPSLPRLCANACGTRVGDTIYIAGGRESPTADEAMKTFWSLDLSLPPSERRWIELEPWPGPPRMLAVAAAQGDSFYLFSGTELSATPDGMVCRSYLKDAYRYRPGSGWTRLADLPRPTVAAPSPAAAVGAERLIVFGGDDGSKTDLATPAAHPGFPNTVLAYDVADDRWATVGETPAPFVTTPLVAWRDGFVVPGGEVRPGVRTPAVFAASPASRRPGSAD